MIIAVFHVVYLNFGWILQKAVILVKNPTFLAINKEGVYVQCMLLIVVMENV